MLVLTFGEPVLRLSPPSGVSLGDAVPGSLLASVTGPELSTAVALSTLGTGSTFAGVIPTGSLGESVKRTLHRFDVQTDRMTVSPRGRLGTVFVDSGCAYRESKSHHDRNGSAFAMHPAADYDFERLLDGIGCVMLSATAPALSVHAAEATLELARMARGRGIRVCLDLHFDADLWRWSPNQSARDLARSTMPEIVSQTDWLIASPLDIANMLEVTAPDLVSDAGIVRIDAADRIARQVATSFPGVSRVAMPLRHEIHASRHMFGGLLFDEATDAVHLSPRDAQGRFAPYDITPIVDVSGSREVFTAGLLHRSLMNPPAPLGETLGFAIAAGCLAHSASGSLGTLTEAEVEAVRLRI